MNGDPTIRTSAMVTILIPLFNGGRFIRETLDSILAQSHGTFEVIVVDDGSTDDGPDIVRTFLSDERCSLVMKPHLGIALTRNTAARLAAGESSYLAFMDQDDLWDDDLLATLVERLDQRPDATAAFALADFVDITGRVMHEGAFSGHMRTREEYRPATGRARRRRGCQPRAGVPHESRLSAELRSGTPRRVRIGRRVRPELPSGR